MHFPKFSISASYDLDEILPQLGIRDLFSKQANLSGITTQQNMLVSKVSPRWPSILRDLQGDFCPSGDAGPWMLPPLHHVVPAPESVQPPTVMPEHKPTHHMPRVALSAGDTVSTQSLSSEALPVMLGCYFIECGNGE